MAKRTLLWEVHHHSGAVMAEFAGWDMPIRYSDIQKEHQAVRLAAGLFDVSHMGELRITGPGACVFVDSLVTNRVAPPADPANLRAIYAPMCHADGGTVDDLFCYVLSETEVLLVVNAGNIDKDAAHIRTLLPDTLTLVNESDAWLQLALQGPAAAEILSEMPLFAESGVASLRFMRWIPAKLDGKDAILSRSGYTGGDGFEIYVRTEDAVWAAGLWDALLDAGRPAGLLPAGLGARDTLRLEGALPLYGHELTDDVTPLEAGLEKFVKLDKPLFVGREALIRRMGDASRRLLVGLELVDRGIAREGCRVLVPVNGEQANGTGGKDSLGTVVGHVTSGGVGVHIGRNIAMALVSGIEASPGTELEVDVRGRRLRARVVALPFYRGSR